MPSTAKALDQSGDDLDQTVKLDMRTAKRAPSRTSEDNGASMEIDLSATQIDSLLTKGSVEQDGIADDDATVEIPALEK